MYFRTRSIHLKILTAINSIKASVYSISQSSPVLLIWFVFINPPKLKLSLLPLTNGIALTRPCPTSKSPWSDQQSASPEKPKACFQLSVSESEWELYSIRSVHRLLATLWKSRSLSQCPKSRVPWPRRRCEIAEDPSLDIILRSNLPQHWRKAYNGYHSPVVHETARCCWRKREGK